MDFTQVVTSSNSVWISLNALGANLKPVDLKRLRDYYRKWNFYEGYHWEEIPLSSKPQVTINYCRKFVDKFVSFELGKGFSIKMLPDIENLPENNPLNFLNDVWEYNNKLQICTELGQAKSVTGDAWIGVFYESPDTVHDPFNEFEKGKIKIVVIPTAIVFPEYEDNFNKDELSKVSIIYPIEKSVNRLLRNPKIETVIYKQVWTRTTFEEWEGDTLLLSVPNRYGTIPIRQIKNFPMQGKTEGVGDIDDVIPLNVELNLKKSDISEIIDYHSAPVTVVFGARVGQLERGANKVWGGLPEKARVENLKLEGDLGAAHLYAESLKSALFEVGGIPEAALGEKMAISNTSGVALSIMFMPIVERIQIKQVMTKEGIEFINKLILMIGIKERMISIPTGINNKDFYRNEVTFESVLPKDMALELQQIESEMSLGLEDREGAMKRLGKSNIQSRLSEIDADRDKSPAIYGLNPDGTLLKTKQPTGTNKDGNQIKTNSGFTNK